MPVNEHGINAIMTLLLKPDKILVTSLFDTYINYETLTTNIIISGNVADTATATFSGNIVYDRQKTRADVYARNTTTNIKRPVTGGIRQSPYTFVSTETCSQTATYNGSQITVTFSVFNGTGAPIVRTAQTMEISAVLYEVPY